MLFDLAVLALDAGCRNHPIRWRFLDRGLRSSASLDPGGLLASRCPRLGVGHDGCRLVGSGGFRLDQCGRNGLCHIDGWGDRPRFDDRSRGWLGLRGSERERVALHGYDECDGAYAHAERRYGDQRFQGSDR
jgi:hypothetical protein